VTSSELKAKEYLETRIEGGDLTRREVAAIDILFNGLAERDNRIEVVLAYRDLDEEVREALEK
jgi:hypothetical protein